jgi:hypothetical protein
MDHETFSLFDMKCQKLNQLLNLQTPTLEATPDEKSLATN